MLVYILDVFERYKKGLNITNMPMVPDDTDWEHIVTHHAGLGYLPYIARLDSYTRALCNDRMRRTQTKCIYQAFVTWHIWLQRVRRGGQRNRPERRHVLFVSRRVLHNDETPILLF